MEPCDPVHPEVSTLEALVRSPPDWAAAVAGTAAAPPPSAAVAAAAAAAAAAGAHGSSTPQHSSRTVPIEDAAALSYDRFVSQYMAPNLPVLIRGVADGWGATRDWVGPAGAVNAAAVCSRAPEACVRVTDAARRHAGCGPCTEMSLREYGAWWEIQRPAAAAAAAAATAGAGAQQGVSSGDELRAVWQQWKEQQEQQHHHLHPHHPQQQQKQKPADQQEKQQQQQQEEEVLSPGWLSQQPGRPSGADGRLLYLKDWHYAAECPMAPAYRLPPYFREDWLNDYYTSQTEAATASAAAGAEAQAAGLQVGERGSSGSAGVLEDGGAPPPSTADYRFVYWGPAGSWTPVHSDVLRSFSWSANVTGAKRWLLLPHDQTNLLARTGHPGDLAPDFSIEDLCRGTESSSPGGAEGDDDPLDASEFPGLAAARALAYVVLQGPGEALFVPSGWHHTVVNLTDCLSINHNWFNAHNAHWGWALLAREHALATAALEDCRETCDTPEEFESLVQRAVAANAGLDFQGWGALLSHAAHTALQALDNSSSSSNSNSNSNGSSSRSTPQLQALFELQRASRLLRALLSEAARTARRNAATAAAIATQRRNPSRIGLGTLCAHFRDVSLHVEDSTSTSQQQGSQNGIFTNAALAGGSARNGGAVPVVDTLPLGPLHPEEFDLLPPGGWELRAAAVLAQVLAELSSHGVLQLDG